MHVRRIYTAHACWVLAVILGFSVRPAAASPWAEAGDPQLRSDIEILAAAGLIDDITTHWPLPWSSILSRLSGNFDGQPAYVRAAASRVLSAGASQSAKGKLRSALTIDATNAPSVVRGFDAMGRQTVQSQAAIEYMGGSTSFRLAMGAQSHGRGDRQTLLLDNSYVAQEIGGAVIYAGTLPHWWGPGWISALSLSTNARPMPQIGIARKSTAAFESPWLSWLGPWQAEFMVGLLDGPRLSENTLYNGLRVTLNPLPGLEIGLARTQMFCGRGHQCKPIAGYFNLLNDASVTNYVNDEGLIDLRYTTLIGSQAFTAYAQVMNEDSNPITHSDSSHLFGLTTWFPLYRGSLRLTAEYTDSIATADVFGFGNRDHGIAYNNGDYLDGMRYRNRTLGFSLDSDSQLASLQAGYVSSAGNSYTFSLHHARISTPLNTLGNVVTTAPVNIAIAELRASLPLGAFKVDLAGRLQDDQPRPDRGFTAAAEVSLAYNF